MIVRLVYVAGPYRGASPVEVRRHCDAAEALGAEIVSSGAPLLPVVPHTLGQMWGALRPDDEGYWLPATLALMERCHAVLMVPGWRHSRGATAERNRAQVLAIPVFEDLWALLGWAREGA